jgi:ribosomal protein S18 acetylase RimI-like enzyme
MNIRIVNLTKLNVLEYSEGILNVLSQDQINYWKVEHLMIDLPMKWEHSYVLLKAEDLVGFIICSIKNNNIHVHKIYIDETVKGKGLGKKILFHCLENVKNIKKCSLFVYGNNIEAIRFYDKRRFLVIDKSIDELGLKYKLEGNISEILES